MKTYCLYIALLLTFSASCPERACARKHTEDFSVLEGADRIDLTPNGRDFIGTITDKDKIAAATSFIKRFPDDWVELLFGPQVGDVHLFFYRGKTYLGEYAVAPTFVSTGTLTHPVSSDEMATLLHTLGIELPSTPRGHITLRP